MDAPSQTLSAARIRSISANGIVALALAALVAILWLPFGLNVGFTGDDWIYFHQADAGTIMSQAAPTRLFIPIPWLIGYGLSPGHFAGINLLLALLIFGKGVLVCAILRRLSAPMPLAFAAAALSILLPADSGVFYMGGLHNQFALFCYLLALYLLLVFEQRQRFSALLGLWLAQIGCVGITEQVYPLVLVSPLALLLVRSKIDRRFARLALLWYVVPLIYALFYGWIVLSFPRAFAYQGSLIEHPPLGAVLTSLINVYARHFVTGWLAGGAALNPAHLLLGGLAGALVFGLCFGLLRRQRPASRPRLTLILALSGLAIIGLSVALYLLTSLRDETLRTYYFSSVGAALALAALFWGAARRPLIFAALVGIFAGIGTLRLLDQHQAYADESLRQQAAFTELARALPQVAAGSGVVVVDETPDHAFWTLIHGALYAEDTIPLLYHDDSLEGAICLPADFGASDPARCRWSGDGISIPSVRTRTFFRPYARLIFVRYDGAFHVVDDLTAYAGAPVADYRPERLTDPSAPLPARIADLFGG